MTQCGGAVLGVVYPAPGPRGYQHEPRVLGPISVGDFRRGVCLAWFLDFLGLGIVDST